MSPVFLQRCRRRRPPSRPAPVSESDSASSERDLKELSRNGSLANEGLIPSQGRNTPRMIYVAAVNVVPRSFEGLNFSRNVANGFVGKVIWRTAFSALSLIVRAARYPRGSLPRY